MADRAFGWYERFRAAIPEGVKGWGARSKLDLGLIRGLAVTLVAELLADPFKDLALRPIAGMTVARDVYALLPPGRRHPLVAPTLEALDDVAVQMRSIRAAGVAGARPRSQAEQQA